MNTRRNKSQPRQPVKPARRKAPAWLYAVAVLLLCAAAAAGALWYPKYARDKEDQELKTASLDQLRDLAKSDPANARVKFYLGPMLMKENHPDEALAVLAEAAKLDPDDGEIAAAYGYTEVAVGNDLHAVEQYQEFLKRHPGNIQVDYALANAYLKQKRYDEAYSLAMTAARAHPAFEAEAYATAADAATQATKRQEAVDALKKAIALDPKKPQYHLDLATAYLALAQNPEAVQSCREALKLAPNMPMVHFALAEAMLRGDTTPDESREALTHLQTAMLNPKDIPDDYLTRAQLGVGECYLRLSDWQNARGWLETAAKGDPVNYAAHFDLVRVCTKLGDTAAAKEHAKIGARLTAFEREKDRCQLLLSQSPDDPDNRLRLGRLYESVGLFSKAMLEYATVANAHHENRQALAAVTSVARRHPELIAELTKQSPPPSPPAPSP